MPVDTHILEAIPDPVLLVRPTGETVFGNQAWRELTGAQASAPTLAAVFGPPATQLVAEALRRGRASAFLPLGDAPTSPRGFRVTLSGTGDGETLLVLLTDLSEEMAWRRQLFLRNSELTVLNDTGAALAGTMDVDALAQRLWEQTGRIMDNANFFLALRDGPGDSVRFALWMQAGQAAPAAAEQPFALAVVAHVLARRRPLLLNGDVAAQLAELALPAPASTCASLVVVPVQSESEVLGVLGLFDPQREGRYGPHEAGILAVVATQAAAAVRTATLFDGMRFAYDELAAAQARLLESERLRGVTETVGALNHEVNNPLATIVGSAQLLLRRDDLEADTRAKVERMLEAARRIQFVTGRMATLIQANSRAYPGQMQILDLAHSVAREETPPVPGAGVSQIMRALRDALPPGPPSAGGRESRSA